MATSNTSAGQYRSRVFTGDLPEGFLQLDDDRTNYSPGGNTQQQPVYQPTVPMHVVTRLKVTLSQAKLAKNYGLTRMDPYCRIRIGHHVFETPTATNGSTNPRWNKTITCPISNGLNSIYVEIFDENSFSPDSQIAWGLIRIKDDLSSETLDEWYPLSGKQGDDKEGMINILMSITKSSEPIPAAPVMIFPQPYIVGPQVYYPPMPYAVPHQVHPSPPPGPARVQVRPEDVKNIKDMFPNMDEEVIRSVLEASGGNVDAALNHLLSMNEK